MDSPAVYLVSVQEKVLFMPHVTHRAGSAGAVWALQDSNVIPAPLEPMDSPTVKWVLVIQLGLPPPL